MMHRDTAEYINIPSNDSDPRSSLDGTPDVEKVGLLIDPERSPAWRRRFHAHLTLSNVLLIALPWALVVLLSAALTVAYNSPAPTCQEWELEKYSPVGDAIEYQDVVFKKDVGTHSSSSEFTGWPSDELDARWEDLAETGATLHITPLENSHLLNKSINTPLPGLEHTHIAGLDVFHQLHCLNKLRKYLYPARYNTSLIDSDGSVNFRRWLHMDHCIDSIRQSLMCSADVAVHSYSWLDEFKTSQVNFDTVHRCRDFERIKEWAVERRVVGFGEGRRKRVEGGRIVDYGEAEGDWGVGHGDHEGSFVPVGWRHSREEMYGF